MSRGWGLARFIGPGGRGFELSFCPGGGEFAHQKNCPGVLPWKGGGGGGWLCDFMNDFHEIVKRACSFQPMGTFFLTGPPSFRHQ